MTEENKTLYDVIIVGAGPAGLSAALYTSRSNLKTLIIEKGTPGGQLLNTDTIENYIGAKSIDANQLAMEMYENALSFGAEYTYGEVTDILNVVTEDNRIYAKVKASGTFYQAKTVVIATGTEHKKLGIPGEDTFEGKGVSYCATCDGPFFQDKNITVVGGGDAALEAANYLTQYGKVNLVHRRDEYRGEPHLQHLVESNDDITETLHSEVRAVMGDKLVEELFIQDTRTGEEEKVQTDGLFVNVGQNPQTDFLPNDMLTKEGWVFVDKTYQTEDANIFAIGDVIDKDVRQVANAVGEGAEVAHYIFNYTQGTKR